MIQALATRYLEAWPLHDEELSFIHFFQYMKTINTNNIITEKAATMIADAIKVRDFKQWSLHRHEVLLLESMALEGDSIREHVLTVFEPTLKRKGNRLPLKHHDLRLLGQLAFKAFKHEKKVSLPSFLR